jgi:hypothetical protein
MHQLRKTQFQINRSCFQMNLLIEHTEGVESCGTKRSLKKSVSEGQAKGNPLENGDAVASRITIKAPTD